VIQVYSATTHVVVLTSGTKHFASVLLNA